MGSSYVCVYPTAYAGCVLGRRWERKMREDKIRSDGQAGLGRRELVVSFGYTNFKCPLDFQVQSHSGMRLESQRV